MKICKEDDCVNGAVKRGWCNKHYLRWYRYGDPSIVNRRRNYPTPQESFESKTVPITEVGCLIWLGSTTGIDNSGYTYGQIWNGEKLVLVHRFAWEQVNGLIPEGMVIDHKYHCSTLCCNTEHLRLATKSQNKMNFSGPPSTNTSGYRNVSWDKNRGKWQVAVGGKYVGRYTDIEEAARVAEQARQEIFKEFAGK